MSAAQPPVGASSGPSAAIPSPSSPPPQQQQQKENTAAQLSDAIREISRQQQQQQQEMIAAQLSDAIREITRQQQQQQEMIAAQLSDAIHEFTRHGAHSENAELRNWLMLVATLTASITYSAAMNPPGGVWQASDPANGYIAGTPVLLHTFPRRYNAFYYCNFTSFATSLCIIALSSTPKLYHRIQRSFLVSCFVTLDLIALAGAFFASSWSSPHQSIYGALLLAMGSTFHVLQILRGALAH